MSEHHEDSGRAGGKSRAKNLTDAERSAISRKGGKSCLKKYGRAFYSKIGKLASKKRQASLTPAERSRIAKKAVDAREAKRKKSKGG